MTETLHNFSSTISLGGRTISNLRFADDIDLLAGSNEELQEITDRLVKNAGAYGMELNVEKCKVMSNKRDNTKMNITINGQNLEEVDNFKYLRATLEKDGRSKSEIITRIALATTAMAKLDNIWKSKNISLPIKWRPWLRG